MTLGLLQLSVALTSATVRLPAVQTLVLSDQAVRLLALDSRSFQTEFLGCMIGEIYPRSRMRNSRIELPTATDDSAPWKFPTRTGRAGRTRSQ